MLGRVWRHERRAVPSSTVDKDLETQVAKLKAEGCGIIRPEKLSGASRADIFKLAWASPGDIDGVPTDYAARNIYRSVKARAKESSIGRARYSKKVRSSVLMNASTGIPG
ncbi:hypothetical protein EJ076_22890 [Mesorhizobium sp. M7D.F.Ca.US.005.01.1.1]|nr:hypothetical protein EJ076_22890 [Mesorhizobium sp. M7D.F.Ca.US.005.01.1.1]